MCVCSRETSEKEEYENIIRRTRCHCNCAAFLMLSFPVGPVPAVINRATMIRFACDLCSAVAYLAEKGLVHKDIAARHCFVTEDFQVKLSLFELHVSSQSWEYDK